MCLVECGLRITDILTVKEKNRSLVNPRWGLKGERVHVVDLTC